MKSRYLSIVLVTLSACNSPKHTIQGKDKTVSTIKNSEVNNLLNNHATLQTFMWRFLQDVKADKKILVTYPQVLSVAGDLAKKGSHKKSTIDTIEQLRIKSQNDSLTKAELIHSLETLVADLQTETGMKLPQV